MDIVRRGRIVAMDFHINSDAINQRGMAILTIVRTDHTTAHTHQDYRADTTRSIRACQKAVNKFTLGVLNRRKNITITIDVSDIIDSEAVRVVQNVKQAYALHEFHAKISTRYQ